MAYGAGGGTELVDDQLMKRIINFLEINGLDATDWNLTQGDQVNWGSPPTFNLNIRGYRRARDDA